MPFRLVLPDRWMITLARTQQHNSCMGTRPASAQPEGVQAQSECAMCARSLQVFCVEHLHRLKLLVRHEACGPGVPVHEALNLVDDVHLLPACRGQDMSARS